MWLNSYEMNTLKDFNCRFGCSKVGNWPRSKTTSGVLSTLTPTVPRWFIDFQVPSPIHVVPFYYPPFVCYLVCPVAMLIKCKIDHIGSIWGGYQGWVYWGRINPQWYIQPRLGDKDYSDGGDCDDGGDSGDSGDLQSPAELERLHPAPVQTVLLPPVGSSSMTFDKVSKEWCDCQSTMPPLLLKTSMVWFEDWKNVELKVTT